MARTILPLTIALGCVLAGFQSPVTPLDPIAKLQAEITKGSAKLEFDPKFGYLPSILKELEISADSQTLVFSKTSMQSSFINQKNPRALYFNDHTYVGFIPGAPVLEIATMHPTLGLRFYTLPNQKVGPQRFAAETRDCVPCHTRRSQFGGPILVAESSYVGPSGHPRVLAPQPVVTPRTRFESRWGGWFVTGQHGSIRHLGNELSYLEDEPFGLDMEKGANVESLTKFFEPKKYLSPHSDIVALLVMEHQMDIQNALAAVHRTLRTNGAPSDSSFTALTDRLTHKGEATLKSPVKGTSTFAESYAAAADQPLRKLDLQRRVFRYPVSPEIYSAAFQSLPREVRQKVYQVVSKRLSNLGGVYSAEDLATATAELKKACETL